MFSTARRADAEPLSSTERRPYAVPLSPTALRTTVAALLVALVLTLAVGPLASRARAEATPQQVASALERSPVFIDPELDGVISPAAGRRIARTVRSLDRDIYVALVSLADGDRFGGRARTFVTALRGRFPRDATFVVSDGDYLTVEKYENGVRDRDEALNDAETIANFVENGTPGRRPTLLQRVETFLRTVARPPAELAARIAAYERQTEREDRQRRAGRPSSAFDGQGGGGGGGGTGLLVLVGAALVIAVVAGVVLRRRRGATPSGGPLPVVPDHVFRHARAAERAELQEDADRELLALATQLDEQPVPDQETAQDAYQRALDAYSAARRRTGDAAPEIDLVGVLVLVDQARGDLARAAALDAGRRVVDQPPLCAFDPLHGRSTARVRWERGLQIPACSACAADVRAGRTPDARRDRGEPYFERDTVWARTGFGAFSDDLVERVARGER